MIKIMSDTPKKKKSYYSKADLLSFGKFIVSDERRGQKQKEAREKLNAGIINFMSWSIAERIVTDEDFKKWKEKNNK
ncbi:unnamed protein product [marine sediment metagenome]|uniref:Uncharacterized protein n=1 Tax=marine sediment metagenome TaxID=412755 RepID=X0Z7W5_9ZZZZ